MLLHRHCTEAYSARDVFKKEFLQNEKTYINYSIFSSRHSWLASATLPACISIFVKAGEIIFAKWAVGHCVRWTSMIAVIRKLTM